MKIKKILEYKLKGERNISSRKPLIFDNKLFVIYIFDKQGFSSSKVVCLDIFTFEVNWEYSYPFVINNILKSPNNSVLICCMDGKFVELNSSNGGLINTINLNLERNGQSSKIVKNKLIVGGIQGTKQTSCLNLNTAQIIWTVTNDGHSYIPLIADNKVYQCTEKNINCFDLESGKKIWSAQEKSTYIFNPTVFNNFIIVGGHGLLNIYNKKNGTLLAQINTRTSEAVRETIVDEENIYFGDSSGKFYCFKFENKKNLLGRTKVFAKLIWEHSTNGCIESTPAFFKDSIIFINDNNKLINLDKTTGALNWTFNTKGKAGISGITINDDYIYTSVGNGYLYKLTEK